MVRNLEMPYVCVALLGTPLLSIADATAAELPSRESDPMQVCVATHAAARKSVAEQAPYFARSELRQCAAEGCPIAIRSECTEWLSQAELQVPTLVFSASTESGDIEQAQVDIDGERVRNSLDGRPMEATPGARVVVFVLPDGRRQEIRIVVGLGEKNRVVRADFAPLEPPPVASRSQSTSQPAFSVSSRSADAAVSRNPAWLFGTVSLGTAMVAGSFLYAGYAQYRAAEDRCSPNCSASEVRKVKRWFVLADVAAATAVVSGGVGLYFYFIGDNAASASGAVLGYEGAF